MKVITTPPFVDSICLNLGSLHGSWLDELPGMLDELAARFELEPSPIPRPSAKKRLGEIRCFCLVPRLVLEETRRLTSPSNSNEQDASFGNLLGLMEDAPWDNEELNPDPVDWDDGSGSEANQECCDNLRPGFDPDAEPEFGAVDNGLARRVILDCYGIYVTSIRSWAEWLKASSCRLSSNPGIEKLLAPLDSGELVDGPAVLICPENIVEIPSIIARRIPSPLRRKLGLAGNPLRQFLRIVLYHEIGHHFFPLAPACRDSTVLSEAMANWFAYRYLPAADLRALHLLSATQSRCYRFYQGLIPLLHPEGSALLPILLAPWAGFSRGETAWDVERRAFGPDRALCITPLHPFDLFDHPFWEEFLKRGMLRPPHSAFGKTRLHPAELYAVILLCAVFRESGGGLAHGFRSICGGVTPLSGIRQLAWHERAWEMPTPEVRGYWSDFPV